MRKRPQFENRRLRSDRCYSYAGWIGTIAASTLKDGSVEQAPSLESSKHRLAAVAGTSTCHMVQVSLIRVLRRSLPNESPWLTSVPQTPSPLFVPGVWGPYKVHTVHWSKFGRLICNFDNCFPSQHRTRCFLIGG